MPDPIQRLIARAEIETVLRRYARALDRLEGEALRECFHPDARVNIGGHELVLEEFVRSVIGILRELRATHHQLGNIEVALDGEVARVETYFTAVHRIGPEGWSPYPQAKPEDDLTMRGRYVDRFECREGRWAMSHRTLLVDWARFDAAEDRAVVPTSPFPRGAPQ